MRRSMDFSKWVLAGYFPLRVLLVFLLASWVEGHEHLAVTHSFNNGEEPDQPKLVLNVIERSTGQLLPARFSLEVDGEPFIPTWVDEHGISFTSIHLRSNNRSTVQFTKGTGVVRVSIPHEAVDVSVSVAKGFEYLPAKKSVQISGEVTELTIELDRWVNLKEDGWIAIDEHLHFDRLDPKDDALWFSMFEADGLEAGHFMVLKGGMTPGVWSRQFSYGEGGQGTDGERMLIPGQEYRDSQQGHINLLGLNEVILPYSTGGLGTPEVGENYPPLYDVLTLARSRNGLAGVAHGGTLGRNSTSLADAVLGAVDFWEVSNGFIYNTENWYRLMNCGYFLPMVAGTDLPNSPFRDDWQPMFGSIRTYVNTGGDISFESFKEALKAGKSFISGGPLIDFQVNGSMMGEVIHLPAGGGMVTVRAALHSPLPLRQLVVVQDGRDIELNVRKRTMAGVHRWSIEADVKVTESGWLSAWGRGTEIKAQKFDAMAHAGVIRVMVGDRPVQSSQDAEVLVASFKDRISFYEANGVYQTDEQRDSVLGLFKEAIQKLEPQM